MQIKTIKSGMVSTNTYIVSQYEECLVIDPGDDLNLINQYLNSLNLKVKAILLTHGHFDHIGSASKLATLENCKIYISKEDEELIKDPKKNGSLKYMRTPITLENNLEFIYEEEILNIGLFSINIYFLPGHTKGSVGYLIKDNLFSGDTLFKGNYGRCDLYGGDIKMMKKSLSFLFSLSDNIKVYPGHGDITTIGKEYKKYI